MNEMLTLHPDDADLVRRLDHELDEGEAAAMNRHIASCAECAARVAALDARSRRLSVLLRASDLAVPAAVLAFKTRPSQARPRWRAAAAIALIAGSAVAVPPVRAWIVATAKSAWAAVAGAPPRPGAAVPVPENGAVGFVPTGSSLSIIVPSREGRLIIEVVRDERVLVLGRNGQSVPGVVILPNEVRLNGTDGGGDYEMRVPLRLETVRVRVGENAPRVYKPGVEGERWSIPLTP